MCRWMAYSGNSLPLETRMFQAEHSLIDQSMSAQLAVEPTNGTVGRRGTGGWHRL